MRSRPSSNLIRFLDQRAPQLAAELKHHPLKHAAKSFESFLERIYANPALLELLNANSGRSRKTRSTCSKTAFTSPKS